MTKNESRNHFMENPVKHIKECELYPVDDRRHDLGIIKGVSHVVNSAF